MKRHSVPFDFLFLIYTVLHLKKQKKKCLKGQYVINVLCYNNIGLLSLSEEESCPYNQNLYFSHVLSMKREI